MASTLLTTMTLFTTGHLWYERVVVILILTLSYDDMVETLNLLSHKFCPSLLLKHHVNP